MERNRQTKIIAIVALCVAVVGLTLGFAAFSNTLTISSKASVTPNESDFKLTIYGVGKEIGVSDDLLDVNFYDSTELSYPYIDESDTKTSALVAKINNDTFTISDISVSFTAPSNDVIYYFIIRNQSEYAAYLDVASYEKIINSSPTCEPGNDATPELVAEACKSINMNVQMVTPDGEFLEDVSSTGKYKIEKDSYVIFAIAVGYASDGARADGEFTAVWDDIELDFSTAA